MSPANARQARDGRENTTLSKQTGCTNGGSEGVKQPVAAPPLLLVNECGRVMQRVLRRHGRRICLRAAAGRPPQVLR
jgi:hypothetical protein